MKKSMFRSDSNALESICRDYFSLLDYTNEHGRSNRKALQAADKLRALDLKCRSFSCLTVVDNEEFEHLCYFFLRPFDLLRELHLYMCPPSLVVDLFDFRNRLEVLEMVQSGITDISSVLAPISDSLLNCFKSKVASSPDSVSVPESMYWSKLKKLRLANCGIASLDATFHLMPEVELIDLSHNSIGRLIHLQDCVCLRRLNISHNCIRRLSSIGRYSSNSFLLID